MLVLLSGAVLVGFGWFVVPQIHSLRPTLERLRGGNGWWLAVAVVLEAGSIAGDSVIFHGVFSRPGNRISWRTSVVVTLAGTAATKVFATAGAGGIALTAWALRAAGLSQADVATGMVAL